MQQQLWWCVHLDLCGQKDPSSQRQWSLCLYRHAQQLLVFCAQFFEHRGLALFDLLPMCGLEQPFIQISSTSAVNLLCYKGAKRLRDEGRIASFEDAWDALLDVNKCAEPTCRLITDNL